MRSLRIPANLLRRQFPDRRSPNPFGLLELELLRVWPR